MPVLTPGDLTRNQNCRRETVRQAPLDNREIVRNLLKIGGRACKPDSVPHTNRRRACARGDHSSSPGIATGIQQPTEGFIEPGRLSPPIWPCTTRGFPCPRCYHRGGGLLPHLFTLAKRREHFEDVSQVSLCDATRASLRRRSILCGTFRDAVVAPGFSPTFSTSPPGVTRRVAPVKSSAPHKMKSVPQDGVRTFLPPSHLAMTKPAITPARPPVLLYNRRT